MAIGARLNATTESLKTASVNVGQANSMLQIADGGMATIDNILVRMKTLSVQSSSGNLSDTERGFLNDEFVQLREEIDRIASSTNFNGIQLLGDGGDVALEFGDLAAGQQGQALVAVNGFDSFAITDNNYWATDANTNTVTDNSFEVNINYVAGDQVIMTVTSTIDGVADRTQSIDITDFRTGGTTAIGAGENATLSFDELGLSFSVNTNFSTSVAAIRGDNTGASDFGTDTTFGTSGINSATGNIVSMAADNGQSLQTSIEFQVGGGNTANDRLAITLNAVDSDTLGAGALGTQTSLLDLGSNAISTAASAQSAVEVVTRAIDDLQRARASVGTSQNRLDFAGQNLATTQENTESARSTLLDLDVAAEMTAFTSKQILVQSGVAMLAQANQMPQNLLRLLQ
jgi:flagellin